MCVMCVCASDSVRVFVYLDVCAGVCVWLFCVCRCVPSVFVCLLVYVCVCVFAYSCVFVCM